MGNRVDSNQAEIVEALRAAGCSVLVLSQAGKSCPGCPDLGVGYHGKNYFLEVKTDKGQLTEAEKKFQEMWRGNYFVVRSVEEALEVLGLTGCARE